MNQALHAVRLQTWAGSPDFTLATPSASAQALLRTSARAICSRSSMVKEPKEPESSAEDQIVSGHNSLGNVSAQDMSIPWASARLPDHLRLEWSHGLFGQSGSFPPKAW